MADMAFTSPVPEEARPVWSREDQGIAELMFAKEAARDRVGRYAKVHFRWTVFMKLIGLVALMSLFSVQWISETRSEALLRVTELSSLGKDVLLQDLILTSSARLLALSGDLRWRDEYFLNVQPLLSILSTIERRAPEIAREFVRTTGVANERLVALEEKAIELSKTNTSLAAAVIFSKDYESDKALLLEGVESMNSMILETRSSYEQMQSWWSIFSLSLVVVALVSKCIMILPMQHLDHSLQKLSKEADEAQAVYSQQVRQRLLKRAEDVVVTVQGPCSKPTLRRPGKAGDPQLKGPKTLKQRLSYLAACAQLSALTGFAIPAALTLVSLYKAQVADPLQQLIWHAKDTAFYDVALTSSARICALSLNESWAEKYDQFIAPMDAALEGLAIAAPELSAEFAARTSAANDALIDMETVALEACTSGSSYGSVVLSSTDYEGNKTLLTAGITNITQAVSQMRDSFEDDERLYCVVQRIMMMVSTFPIVTADLCAVVVAAWMEALSSRDDAEVDESAEHGFLADVMGLAVLNLASAKATKLQL